MIVTLTRAEREKFIAWLQQEINSDTAIMGQMEKLCTPEAMIRQYRMGIGANQVVQKKLESIEEQTETIVRVV